MGNREENGRTRDGRYGHSKGQFSQLVISQEQHVPRPGALRNFSNVQRLPFRYTFIFSNRTVNGLARFWFSGPVKILPS